MQIKNLCGLGTQHYFKKMLTSDVHWLDLAQTAYENYRNYEERDGIPHGAFDSIRRVFDKAGLNAKSLAALGVPAVNGEPYSRKMLLESENFEVMLASWAPQSECAPHNHGSSYGIVWLVSGTFIETQYLFDLNLKVRNSPVTWEPDTLLKVLPGDIHSMKAPQGGISLHLYWPSIDGMKVYDTKNHQTLLVRNDGGAWVPRDESMILKREPWSKL